MSRNNYYVLRHSTEFHVFRRRSKILFMRGISFYFMVKGSNYFHGILRFYRSTCVAKSFRCNRYLRSMIKSIDSVFSLSMDLS